MKPDDSPNLIQISYEEATSTHVDDMLKRQMSMRGEPGVARETGRRWYYQNWFVFMLVGTLAAVGAWALLETSFTDLLYVQGPVQKINANGHILEDVERKGGELRGEEVGWIQVKGEKIWIMDETHLLRQGHKATPFDLSALSEGDTIGVYVEYYQGVKEDVAIAEYVSKDLVKQSAGREAMTLYQLHSRKHFASLLFFPLVAGLVGFAIGGVDGFICRLPKRAIVSALIGLLIGFVGGFLSEMVAGVIYEPLNHLAMRQMSGRSLTTVGFVIQMIGRSLAWGLAGMAMGLGQGIALRSKRLFIYGLLGGVVGGLLGGMLFDPIYVLFSNGPSAFMSRLIALAVVGGCVGAMIGIVELLARDAWLRMVQGPLAGKEFLLFKDVMSIGSSPRSDIYLFNDPLVAEQHAVLRAVGDECEIESRQQDKSIMLNSRSVQRARLRHGDQVTIGRTVFAFQKRKG